MNFICTFTGFGRNSEVFNLRDIKTGYEWFNILRLDKGSHARALFGILKQRYERTKKEKMFFWFKVNKVWDKKRDTT